MLGVKILARMCVSAGLSESSLLVDAISRVKPGKFGRSAEFGQRPCLFHILIIVIKIN